MKRSGWLVALVVLVVASGCSKGGSGPTPELFEQVLEKKLQSLKPSGMTEREVVFQEVKAEGDGRFTATFAIRDYGPGYPANRYFGQTCIGRISKGSYQLSSDGAGGWLVDGRMTPGLDDSKCLNNPAAGVSSQPLSSLGGSAAPSGPIAKSEEPSSGGLPTGKYECWANGAARLLMNFSVVDDSHYVGSDGKGGTYSLEGEQVHFRGGALDGVMPAGFSAVYHRPKGRPTVSFRSGRGAEAAFCERT